MRDALRQIRDEVLSKASRAIEDRLWDACRKGVDLAVGQRTRLEGMTLHLDLIFREAEPGADIAAIAGSIPPDYHPVALYRSSTMKTGEA